MPILAKGCLSIDYTDDGPGQPVVLVHSSVSGNRQWQALTETLQEHYRVLAINLFGYGATTPWPANTPQSLYAQAQLVLALARMPRRRCTSSATRWWSATRLQAAIVCDNDPKTCPWQRIRCRRFFIYASHFLRHWAGMCYK